MVAREFEFARCLERGNEVKRVSLDGTYPEGSEGTDKATIRKRSKNLEYR